MKVKHYFTTFVFMFWVATVSIPIFIMSYSQCSDMTWLSIVAGLVAIVSGVYSVTYFLFLCFCMIWIIFKELR